MIDPSMPLDTLLSKTEAAIQGGVDIIQVWNNWKEGINKTVVITAIIAVAHRHAIPVIINEQEEILHTLPVDGIHFDEIPLNFAALKKNSSRPFLAGITCGNDMNKIEWAIQNELDYISFCSVFPSSSVSTCELVSREVIHATRALTNMPVFLSGGITTDNIDSLKDTGMNGIAVISGIMNAASTQISASQYKQALTHIKQ